MTTRARKLSPGVAAAGVFALTLMLRGTASAQVCHATQSYGKDAHVRLEASGGRAHGPTLRSGSVVRLGLGVGGRGYFGRVTAGLDEYEDYGYSAHEVNISFGQEFAVLTNSRLVLCPETSLEFDWSDSLGPQFAVPTQTRTVDLSLRAGSLRPLAFLPVSAFAGAGFFVSRSAIFAGGPPPIGPDIETSTSTGGFGELGIGGVVLKRLSLSLSFRFPIGLKYGLKVTTATVAFAF
jgi:hypothetical protein